MFHDFKPKSSPRRLRSVPAAEQRQATVDGLRSEMYARAAVLADQFCDGRGVDELVKVDYLAARERFDEAARELRTDRTDAIEANTIALLSQVHPSRLQLARGEPS